MLKRIIWPEPYASTFLEISILFDHGCSLPTPRHNFMRRLIWNFDDWCCAFTYMDILIYAMSLSYMLMMESVLWKWRMLRERRLIDSSLMKLIWVPLHNIVALLYKIFYIYASLSTKQCVSCANSSTGILYARKIIVPHKDGGTDFCSMCRTVMVTQIFLSLILVSHKDGGTDFRSYVSHRDGDTDFLSLIFRF